MGSRAVPWVHDVHEFAAGLTGEAMSHMPKSLGQECEYLHRAAYIFTLSTKLADQLESRYALSSRPTVTYNALNKGPLDEAGLNIRSTLGLSSTNFLIGNSLIGQAIRLRCLSTQRMMEFMAQFSIATGKWRC